MKDAERPGADLPVAPAANEDFVDTGEGFDPRADQRPGWDPYEVWRTRVKLPAVKAPVMPPVTRAHTQAPQKLEREPLPEPLY